MKKFGLLLFISFFALLGKAQDADSLRVLWIGNSYTFVNDLPSLVQKIAGTNGVKLSYVSSTVGGASMADHVKRAPLLKELNQEVWDYVVIQEQSANPAKPTALVQTDVYPYAVQLVSMIRANSPKAKIVFYMTWGHKYGNLEGVADYPLDDDYEGMQERVKTTYLEMAYQNNAWCAPVGMAWKKVREEHPNWVLYNQDQSHPSLLGSYLAANVIFSTIFQKPYQTDFLGGQTSDVAEYIQQTAQSVVLNNLYLLNVRK